MGDIWSVDKANYYFTSLWGSILTRQNYLLQELPGLWALSILQNSEQNKNFREVDLFTFSEKVLEGNWSEFYRNRYFFIIGSVIKAE